MTDEETTVDAKSLFCPKCDTTTAHQPTDDGVEGAVRCLECQSTHGGSGEEIDDLQDGEADLLVSAEDLSEQEDAVEDGDPDEQLMAVREGLARDDEPPPKIVPEALPAKKPKRKGGKRRKKAEVNERLDGIDPASLPAYRTSDIYQVDDYFNHKKFGVGQVVEIVDATKIQVLFRDGKRLMMHGRLSC